MMVMLADRFPLVRIFRLRSLMLLWSGQFLSQIGDSVYRLALAWQVLMLTGSSLAMGTVLVANILPSVLFSLVGGAVADRLPRRMILLLSDSGRGMVVALVAVLAWLHLLQFWHLLVLAVLFGVADSFFFPAYQSLIPEIVETDSLQSANALLQVGSLVSRLIGPALALLCLVTIGTAGAFALDALSFLFSVCSLIAIGSLIGSSFRKTNPQPDQQPDHPVEVLSQSSMRQDISEGLRFIRSVPWIWITITLAAIGNVTYFAPLMTALPRLVAHLGYWLLGLFSTADALGGIAAAVAMGVVHLKRRRGILAYSALLCTFASLVVLGLPFPFSSAVTFFLLAGLMSGIGLGIFEVIWSTVLQEKVPETLLGRVSSVDWLGSNALLPVGLLAIGLLTDRIGPSSLLLWCGLVSLVLALVGMSVRDIRRL
ncbi:MAG: MFS transporter [Ktedonobacteraceae bacterium]